MKIDLFPLKQVFYAYTYGTAAWFTVQGLPLVSTPKMIVTLLLDETRLPTGTSFFPDLCNSHTGNFLNARYNSNRDLLRTQLRPRAAHAGRADRAPDGLDPADGDGVGARDDGRVGPARALRGAHAGGDVGPARAVLVPRLHAVRGGRAGGVRAGHGGVDGGGVGRAVVPAVREQSRAHQPADGGGQADGGVPVQEPGGGEAVCWVAAGRGGEGDLVSTRSS